MGMQVGSTTTTATRNAEPPKAEPPKAEPPKKAEPQKKAEPPAKAAPPKNAPPAKPAPAKSEPAAQTKTLPKDAVVVDRRTGTKTVQNVPPKESNSGDGPTFAGAGRLGRAGIDAANGRAKDDPM